MMDQINIVNDKMHDLTQIAVVLFCEEGDHKTKVSRAVVNQMLHDAMALDSILDHIADNMVEVASEAPHVAGCESCMDRLEPLMNMVKNAIKDESNGAYYTYCVMKNRLPHFRRDVSNDKVVTTLDFRHYQVHVRRFEMALYTNTAQNSLAGLASQLPGVKAMVRYPCECSRGISRNTVRGGDTVMDVVIHLNDDHKWTREDIADWLDSVHDPENMVDLAFKVPEKEEA